MSFFQKLDELITKVDELQTQPEQENSELSQVENNTQSSIINDGANPNDEAEEQNESSEDAANAEAFEKLVLLAEKQQEQIASLKAQMAQMVKQGANVNDGKEAPAVNPAPDVPEDYVPLKELDFSFKGSDVNGY